MTAFFTAGLLMAALGIVLSGGLAIANRKLRVFEDPRIDVVEEMLPKANCGACGTPGCRAFAEMAVDGKIAPGKCTVNTSEMTAAIARYLGVAAGTEEKRVARLACAGGTNVAWNRAHYAGLETCRAAALVSGGPKLCTWGCMGLGDCAVVCDFGAITMNEYGLPVVDEAKCTACGDCVDVCPKQLFSIHPVSHRVWVACKSLALGDMAERCCEVACTGCARCAADAKGGAIQMRDNLAVVDYSKNALLTRDVIERCPTGAIVWIDERGRAHKGADARKITRKSPLPCAGAR